MSCAENHGACGAIIFRSTDENDLLALQRFVAAELIRFGRTSPLFHPSPENQAVFLLEKKGLYLKGGVPWAYPFEKVRSKFPNIRIKVFPPSANQHEWDSVTYGDTAPLDQFAQLEGMLIKDHFLPLKLTPATTNVSVVLETKPPSSSDSETNSEEAIHESKANEDTEEAAVDEGNGLSGEIPSIETDTDSVEVDPQIERAEHIDKIKGLIRDGQEILALQLVRSLNDPEIYEALLSDCCEISDEDEGWIQVSKLFEDHDALFYQLLALAPEEASLPGPLRLESIEDIHLNHCASLTDLDFLKHFIALKSFSIWGASDDAVDLNDISGLEGLPRLKSLQLNGLKSSPDWTPLQHLVQLRELTLSGEKLAHPGPLVFSRLTKLKELSITCNGAVEMQGLSACNQLNSLTLNEAKSLGLLSFLESLESLRCLRIDGYGGDSLKGIGKCRKITEFSISDAGKLEDISELSSLSRLRELTLSGKFQNLDPLNSLASLQTLYINDAKELRDVSGLSGCLGLERINLNGVSSLGSLWGIGQLKSLQELELYSWESTSGYIDIHEVRELSNLRDLTISCSGRVLRGFPTVRHLEKLRSLDLSGCNCREVTDLSPLRKLKLLNSLKMANCQSVANLNGLSDLHCLETLELIGLPRLASLSGLREFDQLQQLTITGCTEIEGLDDLANLNSLTHLALRNFDKLCDASGIHGMTQLETLDLEGAGQLSDISFLNSLENLNSLDLSRCYRIHPDDFVHLNEDDFETLYLPDVDEYEDEDNDEDEAEDEDNVEEEVLTREIAEQYIADEDSFDLYEFTRIDDAAAESLAKHEGDLYLNGLTELSDAAAESLAKSKHWLHLNGLTELSDAAAESLAKSKHWLHLNGLTELSDAAAESLAKHEGGLSLNGLTELSDAAIEALAKHEGDLYLDGLTELSDAAVESLAKHEGGLSLDGLTELSDAAIEALAKHEGDLYLDGLTELSDAAVESLAKHEGELSLDGLTELSDATIEALSKHEGDLYLNGLTELSDAAAESLAKHEGDLYLNGLTELSDAAIEALSKKNGTICWQDPKEWAEEFKQNRDNSDGDNDEDEAEEECGEDEEQKNPWGERNLNDIPDDEWLRLYNKEQGTGLLQRAVGEGWLDRVPEYIGTRENLLAVEALHFAAQNHNFSQLPDSLLTVDNLLAEDADHHWNVFHFAAGYGSLDLMPDHLLVEKNLRVPTRADCPFFDNIFAGSTCLHIAAAQGVLTLLPRSILTTQNLLLQDDRGNTPLDKAEEGLRALKDTIAELEENEAEQTEIDFHGDWLQTSQIQIAHLRQQVAEAEISEKTMTGEEPKGESTAPDKLEPSLLQEDIDTTDSSSPLIEQPESVEEDQQNGHNVCLFDVMLDAEEDSAEIQNVLEAEPALEGIGAAFASNHIAGQTEAVCESQYTDQAVGVIEEVMSKGKREESPKMLSITELSLDDQPAQQKQKLTQKISVSSLSLDNQPVTQAEEPVAEEPMAEEPMAEEPMAEEPMAEEPMAEEPMAEEPVAEEPVAEEEISPLVMNTWFHNLGEAIDHPKAVVTLDIIHQESMDRLGVLSDFPHLEELHFIKVNIDNFKGLIPVSKLCHIQLESCEVNGWMGLLDLEGLKKLGCFPGYPPEEVKRLLEDEGVEIYLFTPTRANETGALGGLPSSSKTQMTQEEVFA